jgi:hypothetical protein
LKGVSARMDSISLVSSGEPIQANFAQSNLTSFLPPSWLKNSAGAISPKVSPSDFSTP